MVSGNASASSSRRTESAALRSAHRTGPALRWSQGGAAAAPAGHGPSPNRDPEFLAGLDAPKHSTDVVSELA